MPNNDSTGPILRLDGIWRSICKRAHISFVVEFFEGFKAEMSSVFGSSWFLAFFGTGAIHLHPGFLECEPYHCTRIYSLYLW